MTTSILVEHDPSPMKLEVLGVDDWPVSNDPVSIQEKVYEQTEITYIVEGYADIVAADGSTTAIQSGDLVTFMPDARCTWNITEAIERHYSNG